MGRFSRPEFNLKMFSGILSPGGLDSLSTPATDIFRGDAAIDVIF